MSVNRFWTIPTALVGRHRGGGPQGLMYTRALTFWLLATLVFVAAAPEGQAKGGTPITTCGQVVTTNAVLTADLDCAGDGVVVAASGITIDLRGHTLRGDRSPGHDGIDDSGAFDRVTVENGVVRNFESGIYAVGHADRVVVSGVVLSGSAYGSYVVGDAASIKSSTFAGNATGIDIFGDSASVAAATVVGNEVQGILVTGDAFALRSSTVSGNGASGISVEGNQASVRLSTLSGNTGQGIDIVGDSASVSSSTAAGNDGGGVFVFGEAAQIKSNRSEGNGFMAGASDGVGLGIRVPNASSMTTPPTGTNAARGNDDPAECDPAWLC